MKGDWGGFDYDDINDGMSALERQGIVDPARELIAGWSYGGFMSAWVAGHNTHFKAAIAGQASLRSRKHVADDGCGPRLHRSIFRRPGAQLGALRRPFAGDLHARRPHPVLLLHGDDDARVPAFQARLFYDALKDQGSPVSLVRYPGAPHWFGGAVGADYESDVQQRVLDWVERHVAPADATGGGRRRQGSSPSPP